jgi:hypothetical protein
MRQQFLGKVIKGANPIAAPNLAFDFVIAEVPGIALEQSNFVEPLGISEQPLKRRPPIAPDDFAQWTRGGTLRVREPGPRYLA